MRYCINPDCNDRENSDDAMRCQVCQTPLIVQGRYQVIKPLRQDKAALAEVFLVSDLQDNQRQKVMKTLITGNPKAYQLFEQEQSLLKTFGHPGIPRGEASFAATLGNGKSLPCLVMEYIEGIDLEHWLQRYGAIDQKQALPWLRQLTDILDFIHERGYFHRDIKPANIMRHQTGQLALIDFGTVREIDEAIEGRKLTILGTPGYTAPEQWQGEAVPQSDFYALGMTFIHLLTGLHPEQHQPRIQDWRRKAVHAITPPFADLIDRLIALNPQDRPTDAATLMQQINALTAASSSTPLPLSSSTPPSTSSSTPSSAPPSIPPSTPPAENTPSTVPSDPKPAKKRLPLLLLGAALLGLAGAAYAVKSVFFTDICDRAIGNYISCGEEVLLPQPFPDEPTPIEKQQGVAEYQRGRDYEKAYDLLNTALEKQRRRDPETMIYRNNAWLKARGIKNQPVYTIAVATPLNTPDSDNGVGLMILRGIAQAQDQAIKEFNMNLQVMIADDGNNVQQAETIAETLSKNSQIMAVIGHYASEVTIPVVPIYQQHQLVLLSPAATAAELSKEGERPDHVFFRTVDSTQERAEAIVRYFNEKAPNQKFAIFYNQGPNNAFSKSMRDEFAKQLPANQLIESEFDLSSSRFNAWQALDEAVNEGATAIAVFPDGHTNPVTFQNALNVITANQGRLWVTGANTLHAESTLKQARPETIQRFVIVAVWHSDKAADPDFPKIAEELWGGAVSGQAAHAYDAGQVLIKALSQQPSDRTALRDILADPNFSVKGVTAETVSFAGSDRKETTLVIEKIVPICPPTGALKYTFVTIDNEKPCYQDAKNGN